ALAGRLYVPAPNVAVVVHIGRTFKFASRCAKSLGIAWNVCQCIVKFFYVFLPFAFFLYVL
ncbi:MAG: hypothetical protein AAB332_04475, partial [Planctomycetota bacterium]